MTPEREAEARALLRNALDTMLSVQVFVTSKERIKHPEGEEWFQERIDRIRAWLAVEEGEDGTERR